jgi:hypothetical protein
MVRGRASGCSATVCSRSGRIQNGTCTGCFHEFFEPVAASAFSFLRGACQPGEMVARAHALGMGGIGIADRNTVAGVVRA